METRNQTTNPPAAQYPFYPDQQPFVPPPSFAPQPRKHYEGETQLDETVTKSTLYNRDSKQQAQNIFREFNKDIKDSCFTTSLFWFRGEWINRDEFLLGHRNKRAELALFNEREYIARVLTLDPNVTTETIGRHKHNELFFGAHGSFVLNVPVGHYAKAWAGNIPLIFGEGPHVIHDPLFKFDKTNGLVSQATPYIQHGTLHILRVPPGAIAKVSINNKPELLEAGTYVFNHPIFKFHPQSEQELFYKTTDKVIVHGSIKRFIPYTCEAIITYESGKLKIYNDTSENKGPIVIDDPTFEVKGFIDTSLQNKLFPGKETIERNKLEYPHAKNDDHNFIICTTKNSQRIGVKLFVSYVITEPQKALRILKNGSDILTHIENRATADMTAVVRNCVSEQFMSLYRTTAANQDPTILKDLQRILRLKTEEEPTSIQQLVEWKLRDELEEFGIYLRNLNFENPTVLDEEIAKKLAEQSMLTATTNTEAAVLDQKTIIIKKTAMQEAEKKQIAQDQLNQATISQATAKRDAAKLEAEAVLIKAKAERDATILKAEAEKEAGLLVGEQYQKNSLLFDLKVKEMQTRLLAAAIEKVQIIPQLPPGIFGPAGVYGTLFNTALPLQPDARLQQDRARLQLVDNDPPRAGMGGK